MSARPWTKFYWNAWETDPALILCSMAAQGFWVRLLAICAKADGYLLVGGKRPTAEQLAKLTHQAVADVEKWIAELGEMGVFSRTRGGVIFSRRMREDIEKLERSREFGRRGGNPAIVNKEELGEGVNPRVKVEEEEEEEEEPPNPQGGAIPSVSKADVEAVWALANDTSRKRSSMADLETALKAAAKRRHRPDHVAVGVRGYFASEEARKNGGAFAKGVHRIVQKDRWMSFLEAGALTLPVDPPTAEVVWRRRVRAFRDQAYWERDIGPRPGKPGCQAPPEILVEFGFTAEVIPFSAGDAA